MHLIKFCILYMCDFSGPKDKKNCSAREWCIQVWWLEFSLYMFKIYPILPVIFSLSVLSNLRIHMKMTFVFYFQNTSGLVVCFLPGNSLTSEFYVPTFRNTHLFHLHRRLDMNSSYLPTYEEEQTACSETSAYEIRTPGNYPEESSQHSEHGESFKSRTSGLVFQASHSRITITFSDLHPMLLYLSIIKVRNLHTWVYLTLQGGGI